MWMEEWEGAREAFEIHLKLRSAARFNSLSDDVMALCPISILGRLESSFKL